MICQSCQKEINNDAKFCKFCGKEIAIPSQPKVGSVDLYFQNKNKTYKEESNKIANTEMFKGLGLIILGLVITGISYAMAGEGGRYYIFWGISVYGAYIFIKSFSYR